MILKPEPQPVEGVEELKHIEGMKEQVKKIMADLEQLADTNKALSEYYPAHLRNESIDDIHSNLVSAVLQVKLASRGIEKLRKDVARFAGMTREDAVFKIIGDFVNGK